ncbi:neprilysin-1-like isoform X2 [Ornithodoros turicata]|uniref:neprilysin-1-like isoform X2 n=1 Tax=Ornithodoros turicata TaxID=34597 RepID=UPI003139C7FA
MGAIRIENTVCFSIIYMVILSPGMYQERPKSEKVREVCHTTQCQKKAELIQGLLSEKTDPCDDFYDYVCEKWIKANPIPEDKSYYGIFTKLGLDLQMELKDVPQGESFEALQGLMSGVGLAVWPVFSPSVRVPKWQDTFRNIFVKLGLSPIFSVGVAQDLKEPTTFTLQMDQLTFGVVGRNQFLNQTEEVNRQIIAAYKEYIMGITKLVTSGGISHQKLRAFADDIVELETELAKRSRAQEERRDFTAMYKKKTIYELEKELPQVNWLDFFNSMLREVNITVNETEPVVVLEMEYYKSTLDLLTTFDKVALHNYFGFKVVSSLGPDTSEKFRYLLFELNKVAAGVKQMQERWMWCIQELQFNADNALGRIYIEKKFSSDAKRETVTLVKELRRTFHTLIKTKKWMDKKTKKQALKKVDTLGSKIGYAEWLMNDTHLETKYKYIKNFTVDTPYVEIIANFYENDVLLSMERLHTYYNKTIEWVIGPAIVNAFYNPNNNDVSFPAGILQPPFYEYGIPLSLNMGAMGSVIGHEITHAFDDTGSQFDASGRLHNWWSKRTKKAFNKGAQCFIDQYKSIKDNQTSLYLNGVNTQGENIADNGGLLGAFLTYKRLTGSAYESPDLALPGLESVTGEQMFFIANAIVWCHNTREAELRQEIQYEPHSPARYRIMVPMGNLPEFSKAFKCSSGSRMNPAKKCRIW